MRDLPKQVVHVRRATLADKEAVLRIDDNVYDGRDYLPCYYDNLITMDTTIAYVVVWDGKIVAFTLFSFVDNGHRADGRAARTHVQHRKCGTFPVLTEQFLSDFPEQWSRTTMCIANTSPIVRPGRKILITRPFYLFETCIISDLLLPSHHKPVPTLDPVTDDTWVTYITEPTFSRYLFQNKGIVIDSVFFSLMVSNIPLIRKTGGRQLLLSDCRRGLDGTIQGLLSVSSWFKNRTSCCNLDLFGFDLTSLQHHIAAHLKYGTALYPDKLALSLSVNFEKTVDVTVFDKILIEMGLKRKFCTNEQGQESTTMYIVEGVYAHDRPTGSKL